MKKIIVVSLLLVSAFIIGSSGKALAQCQDYSCSGIEKESGEVTDIYSTCLSMCSDEFEVNVYGGWFECYLYPSTGSTNLLGTADTCCDGWAGCSVEFRGRSLRAKLSYIQENEEYTDTLKCKPCDNCCPDTWLP
jgi:hypothetical protein